MKRRAAAILAAALSAATVGCVAQPSLLNPGPEKVQQARAQRFDPYPSNELGPSVGRRRPSSRLPESAAGDSARSAAAQSAPAAAAVVAVSCV